MPLNEKHLEQMRHAVGFFSDAPGYRNAFHTEKDDPIWSELKELGFAEGGIERLGSCYFWVSDAGKSLIGLQEQQRFKESIDRRHQRFVVDLCEEHDLILE